MLVFFVVFFFPSSPASDSFYNFSSSSSSSSSPSPSSSSLSSSSSSLSRPLPPSPSLHRVSAHNTTSFGLI